MTRKWLQLFLIIAVLAVNLGFTVGAASAQTTYATYVVQPGDTLGKIAAKYCTTWTVIYNLNRNVIYNPNVIYAGTVLTVPLNCSGSDGGGPVPGTCVDNGARTHAMGTYYAPYYTVYWGDTLYSIGKRFGIPWQSISSANGLYYPTIYAGQSLLIPCGGSGTTPPPTQPPSGPTRVQFPQGATSATLVGTINQGAPASFILWASAGQTMTVQTVSRGEALVITISGTGGDLPLTGTNSQVSNTVSATLPATGDYTVTVRPTTAPESPTLKFDITFIIK
ncbi:MAG: LysM peptidoglycan-binding domain-containing protein [Bacteroidota bacterium]|jgi:LysM repeat protein